jgi:hypothetical protein
MVQASFVHDANKLFNRVKGRSLDFATNRQSGLRSTGIISAGREVIGAFRGFEGIGTGVEGAQQARDGSFRILRREAFSLE